MEKEVKGFCFMSFAKGSESKKPASVKRYIGLASCYVLAVNPDKKKLEGIYGREMENEPSYLGENEDPVTGNKYRQARIDFILKVNGDRHKDSQGKPIDAITKVSFFLGDRARTNKDKTKVQVIDKYGRTAWVTREQFQKHEVPVYSTGPANICQDYRACYDGEEGLILFLKAYLGIGNVMEYDETSKTWSMKPNPEDYEASLEEIKKYFEGDFRELEEVLKLQPNNKVKVLFGVKTTDKGQFQDIYNREFLMNNTSNHAWFDKRVSESKASGAYPNTEFDFCDLREYEQKKTDFTELPQEDGNANPWF